MVTDKDGAFSCIFQKRRMHHHLQKMEGQESLFLKGFSPIYHESILYGSITSPVLKGAHCSHALWLAYISSPLTWLPPSHGPDYVSNVISEKPGLAPLLEQHLLSHDDISSKAMPTFSSVWDATLWVWSCTVRITSQLLERLIQDLAAFHSPRKHCFIKSTCHPLPWHSESLLKICAVFWGREVESI